MDPLGIDRLISSTARKSPTDLLTWERLSTEFGVDWSINSELQKIEAPKYLKNTVVQIPGVLWMVAKILLNIVLGGLRGRQYFE